jgi:16S rRNA (adenine1518-N6/adenine1519-N6)-dimethyltransferase
VIRDQTIELLKKNGIDTEAALDEQQLIDSEAIITLIEASGLKPTDTVLEIGPGAGNITIELAKRARKVFALEKSPKFLRLLKERLSNYEVEILIGDALTTHLPQFDVLISNLPYSIAEAFFQRLKRLRFKAASLLVPSSFATTLTAERGKLGYSKLSFEAYIFFDVKLIIPIKPSSYYPQPRTETAIIVLKPKENHESFETVVWHMLQQNDKKVINALREAFISSSMRGYPSTKKCARKYIDELGLDAFILQKRVAALSLADVDNISILLEENPI